MERFRTSPSALWPRDAMSTGDRDRAHSTPANSFPSRSTLGRPLAAPRPRLRRLCGPPMGRGKGKLSPRPRKPSPASQGPDRNTTGCLSPVLDPESQTVASAPGLRRWLRTYAPKNPFVHVRISYQTILLAAVAPLWPGVAVLARLSGSHEVFPPRNMLHREDRRRVLGRVLNGAFLLGGKRATRLALPACGASSGGSPGNAPGGKG